MQSTNQYENNKTNEKRVANTHSVRNNSLFSQMQKNDFINYATQMMDFYSISKPWCTSVNTDRAICQVH